MSSSRSSPERLTKNEGKQGTASLLNLFEPPPPSTTPLSLGAFLSNDNANDDDDDNDDDEEQQRRRSTIISSNSSAHSRGSSSHHQEIQTGDPRSFGRANEKAHEKSPLLPFQAHSQFDMSTDFTPKAGVRKSNSITGEPTAASLNRRIHLKRASQLPSIREIMPTGLQESSVAGKHHERGRFVSQLLLNVRRKISVSKDVFCQRTTWIGAFMFLLFHVVFALTIGATITRPHGTQPMLGAMTKMASLGIMCGGWPYWLGLNNQIPAMYPTVDLFSAPFLAHIAILVDESMQAAPEDGILAQNNDEVFLTTFSLLAVISLFISSTLLVLASIFKLVNLGAFLPFPVLCGFFTAVGIMMWTLAFKVDNGLGVHDVLVSGDRSTVEKAFLHHLPTVVVAGIMKYLGPKNPLYVVGVVFATIGLFYAYMFVFQVTREHMIQEGWFWSSAELVYDPQTSVGFSSWSPPAPFGWISSVIRGKVYWPAVWNAIDPAIALGFLYLIRCSLHGTAMKKNVPNLQRARRDIGMGQNEAGESPSTSANLSPRREKRHRRHFSEIIDIDFDHLTANTANPGSLTDTEKARPTNVALKDILVQYGFSQIAAGVVGGFAVTPSVAASGTMFVLRAETLAPQVGSVILVFFFYMSNFALVGYIPKPAFSSLLVLAFIDIVISWFVKSYLKTKETIEWLVVPLIVILAFAVGLLQAVFLGIGISTFFFVSSFFRSGVVKYMANGVTVRSTIERPVKDADWLDQNGDLVQILVLQNYLFFGNASTIEGYISSMFEETEEDVDPIFLPPLPRILILDLTLVSGMDTSAVDAFSDIISLCGPHDCKVFLSGVSSGIRQVMFLGGVKAETIRDRTKRKLRFFPDLDSAVGKAEDILLEMDRLFEPRIAGESSVVGGFMACLRAIDEQHQTTSEQDLPELRDHVELITLESEQDLYDKVGDRGLFFIEDGILRIERAAGTTTNRAGGNIFSRFADSSSTLTDMRARSGSIGRAVAEIKAGESISRHASFRIARIGPGWVIGSIEVLSKRIRPAPTVAVTSCRLYFLSFASLDELEAKNPVLILRLYKLLAYLAAKRQEVTIGQLGTLHAIMSAPAQKQPMRRVDSFSRHNTLHEDAL